MRFLYCCYLLFLCLPRNPISAEDLPHPDTIPGQLDKSIEAFEKTFHREHQQIRADYLNQLTQIQTTAIEQGRWTSGVWAHRNQRVMEELDENWIALFAESFELPEGLKHLNDTANKEVTHLRGFTGARLPLLLSENMFFTGAPAAWRRWRWWTGRWC